MSKVTVMGAGSWGTALATVLDYKGHEVFLWSHEAEQVDPIRRDRENRRFLPGVEVPESILVTTDMAQCLSDCEACVMAVPTQAMRQVAMGMKKFLGPQTVLINVAKGFEIGTCYLMTDVLGEIFGPANPLSVLSGPSHAEEVGRRLPTTVVAVAEDLALAEWVQDLFINDDYFRVYVNNDLTGVQLAGGLKNIIAIACGIADGIGLGDNAQAAILTRGLHEITRLGLKMGARESTFAGLTGLGDLVVTCGSRHSRNRRLGRLLGEGHTLASAIDGLGGMVAEGVYATQTAVLLAEKYDVEMPITETIYNILNNSLQVREAILALMARQRKPER